MSKPTAESVRQAFHYFYPDELPFLQKLVLDLPADPIVVNIGAGAGTSGLAVLEVRQDVHLVTVDVQDESSPFGCLEAERDVVRRAGYHHLYGNRWWQIHADSKTIGLRWRTVPLRRVDLVFIDGDHSYEGCAGDIRAWLSNLKAGGVLAVHDYNKHLLKPSADGPHPKPWDGVNQAVDELLMRRYEHLGTVESLIAFRIKDAL